MSGGSMEYVYLHIKEAAGLTEDETIAHLLIDLSKVLHDEEWADCCDISDEEYQDTLLKFKRKWLKQEQKTEWIPVSERLPKDHEDVLINLSSNQITIGLYNSHRLPFMDKPIGWGADAPHIWSSNDVIAWMPLPKPYKAEKEGKE